MDGFMDALQQAAIIAFILVVLFYTLVSLLIVYCFHEKDTNEDEHK